MSAHGPGAVDVRVLQGALPVFKELLGYLGPVLAAKQTAPSTQQGTTPAATSHPTPPVQNARTPEVIVLDSPSPQPVAPAVNTRKRPAAPVVPEAPVKRVKSEAPAGPSPLQAFAEMREKMAKHAERDPVHFAGHVVAGLGEGVGKAFAADVGQALGRAGASIAFHPVDPAVTLVNALRQELVGEPIRVIEIAPGMVHTEEFSLVRLGGDQAKADVFDSREGFHHPTCRHPTLGHLGPPDLEKRAQFACLRVHQTGSRDPRHVYLVPIAVPSRNAIDRGPRMAAAGRRPQIAARIRRGFEGMRGTPREAGGSEHFAAAIVRA